MKPFQKKREKERTLEPNLFDDNIDIFADLNVKPKEKSKKKVEAKSVFGDDTGECGHLSFCTCGCLQYPQRASLFTG